MPSPTDTPLPDWALAQADAALKVGQTMPEIERRLVAKGLAAETAAAVVTAALEGPVRQKKASLAKAKRANWIHRILSALVGGVCILIMYGLFGPYLHASPSLRRRTVGGVMTLVAFIWFIDGSGAWYGKEFSSTKDPPAVFIRWCVWVLLVLVCIVFL
jgi:hypothetical protein